MVAISRKHLQINKANTTVVAVSSIAVFICVFSLVAGWALLGQYRYQARVISEKSKALKQLKDNYAAVEQLKQSYDVFIGEPTNVIGGSAVGDGPKSGDNARIILNALPSKYDFPAMLTSIEKLAGPSYKDLAISGTDDEVVQSQQNVSQVVEMPFTLSAKSGFAGTENLIGLLYRSIRPVYVNQLSLKGGDDSLQLSVTAKTYYQPGKQLKIETKEVQ